MIIVLPATALASLRPILHRAADDAARGAQDRHLHRVQDAQIRRAAALHRAGGTHHLTSTISVMKMIKSSEILNLKCRKVSILSIK